MLTEPLLRDYFDEKISIKELIKASKASSTQKMIAYGDLVEEITEGEYLVERKHLIKCCDDVINNSIDPNFLDELSFLLIGSIYFNWNSNDNVISEVIFEWNNPTINFPLTKNNIKEWKKYLMGEQRNMEENKDQLQL